MGGGNGKNGDNDNGGSDADDTPTTDEDPAPWEDIDRITEAVDPDGNEELSETDDD